MVPCHTKVMSDKSPRRRISKAHSHAMLSARSQLQARRDFGRKLAHSALFALFVAIGSPAATAQTPSHESAPVAPRIRTAATPPHIAADDPQLAPPPQAPRTIGSWHEALRLLRQQAPRYQRELENVARARVQSQLAVAAVLPSMNGSANYTRQFITEPVVLAGTPVDTPVPNVVGLSAVAGWQVGNLRSYYNIGTAGLNAQVSERGFAEQRRQLANDVLDALLGTLVTARVAEINRVGLRATLEREQLARTRLHYGQGTTLDVDRAASDVVAARGDVVRGDEALRRAREALGLTLGSSTPIAAASELDLERFEQAVVDTCRLHREVEERADVATARLRVQLSERSSTDVYLQFSPSLSVLSRVSYNSMVTYGPKTTWDLQAILNVPIFDATRYAQLEDARVAARQARADLNAVRLQALVEVSQATRASEVARKSLTIAEDASAVAERVDQSTRTAYADGLATSLELVNSAQDLRRARLSAIQARFELVRARSAQILALAECQY